VTREAPTCVGSTLTDPLVHGPTEPDRGQPAAFSTRTRSTWCDSHITEILHEGGLEPLEPKPKAWRLTRRLACGCEAHHRLGCTLGKNAHGKRRAGPATGGSRPAASLPSSFSVSRPVLATSWVYGVSAGSSQASQPARSTVRVASVTAVVGAS
jgi:hypothetical protein